MPVNGMKGLKSDAKAGMTRVNNEHLVVTSHEENADRSR